MGYCIDGKNGTGIELRRESVVFWAEHAYANESGEYASIEMSYSQLAEIVRMAKEEPNLAERLRTNTVEGGGA